MSQQDTCMAVQVCPINNNDPNSGVKMTKKDPHAQPEDGCDVVTICDFLFIKNMLGNNNQNNNQTVAVNQTVAGNQRVINVPQMTGPCEITVFDQNSFTGNSNCAGNLQVVQNLPTQPTTPLTVNTTTDFKFINASSDITIIDRRGNMTPSSKPPSMTLLSRLPSITPLSRPPSMTPSSRPPSTTFMSPSRTPSSTR